MSVSDKQNLQFTLGNVAVWGRALNRTELRNVQRVLGGIGAGALSERSSFGGHAQAICTDNEDNYGVPDLNVEVSLPSSYDKPKSSVYAICAADSMKTAIALS
jgi:hypothetical protein